MADKVDVDVDAVIEKLLEVRGQRPGKQVQLTEEEIRGLCILGREVFLSQPILLELQVCIASFMGVTVGPRCPHVVPS